MRDDDAWEEGFSYFVGGMATFGSIWVGIASVVVSGGLFGVWEVQWGALFTPLVALVMIGAAIGVPLFIMKRREEIKNWERRGG